MTQMVYDGELCDNEFIRGALDTIGNLNNIALDNYCSTLMKVRTQQAEVTSLKPYLEHFSSLTHNGQFYIGSLKIIFSGPIFVSNSFE